MARKRKTRASRTRSVNKGSTSRRKRTSSKKEGPAYRATRAVTQSAIAAAIELGKAAQTLKESFDHVYQAREQGKEALRPVRGAARAVKRVGRRAVRATKRAASRVTG